MRWCMSALVFFCITGCAGLFAHALSPAHEAVGGRGDQGPVRGARATAARERLQVIVDIDPSGLVDLGLDLDDDLALLALLGSEEVDVLGVTVTFGNTLLRSALQNCRSLLRIAGRSDIPVHAGSEWWFADPLSHFSNHNAITPAAAFIIDTVTKHPPNSVTLLALGPLTNIAEAFSTDPTVAPRLKQLVMMGGDMHPNHVFDIDLNFILSDRPAARRVFGLPKRLAPPRTVVVPIQTCIQAAFTQREVDALQAYCPGAAACQHAAKLQKAVDESPPIINEQFRGPGYAFNRSPRAARGFFPWDMVATMALLRPDMFDGYRQYRVSIRGAQSYFAAERPPPLRQRQRQGWARTRMAVTVPGRVVDEAALLGDAVRRMGAVPHAEPHLVGTTHLAIPGNRRVFQAFAVVALALLAGLLSLLVACCRCLRKQQRGAPLQHKHNKMQRQTQKHKVA